MRLLFAPLLVSAACVTACMKYVPVNLPLQLESRAEADSIAYRDDLGRAMGGAEANGPQYSITMTNGTQFVVKSPRIVGDSVMGYYRPNEGESWALASFYLFDMRVAEEKTIDWFATAGFMATPITLALLLTM
jgi:hypothetical protein